MQCAEQCRHADTVNPGNSGNNNNYGGNNNGKTDSGAAAVVVSRNRGSRSPAVLNMELYPDQEIPTSSNEARKIRNGKNNNLGRSLARHQSAHPTPARKRSSLARPVRVHDSFVQPKRLMETEEGGEHQPLQDLQRNQQQQQQAESSYKNPWWWEYRDHQEPNTSSYVYHRDAGGDAGGTGNWPIRLRLEQMLELTLPQTKRKKKKKKKKKATATMMLMKQQQHSRQGFKDTERLLKVLSINNVDQDNRYNVKRCSVM